MYTDRENIFHNQTRVSGVLTVFYAASVKKICKDFRLPQ